MTKRIRWTQAWAPAGAAALALAGAVALVALLTAAPPVASAAGCGHIRLGGTGHAFYKQKIACDRAKRKARRIYRTRGDWTPRRFRCRSGSGYRSGAHCEHRRHERRYFGWHSGD